MAPQLEHMDAESLREFASQLMTEIMSIREENAFIRQDNTFKQLRIDQLSHEMAVLKRLKFAARREQLNAVQRQLFDETLEADLEAISLELDALKSVEQFITPKGTPRRAPLPADLPRTDVLHEPESTVCSCGCARKRMGEDISELSA